MTVYGDDVKVQHITLRLDEELVKRLKRLAKENDRSLSAEARQAFRAYLREQEESA